MDAIKIRRFQNRVRNAHRRLVAIGVVACLAALAAVNTMFGASTAEALSPGSCTTTSIDPKCLALTDLIRAANPTDVSPKDMQLAAPGGVIAATSNDIRDVNRWRPNPQAWVDAKGRMAAGSGLTTEDVRGTSRWAPKLVKGVGLASFLANGTQLAWTLRDDWLQPALGLEKANVDFYCQREANIAMDLLGGLAATDCPSWRLNRDYQDLVAASFAPKAMFGGKVMALGVVDTTTSATDTHYGFCYAFHPDVSPNDQNFARIANEYWKSQNLSTPYPAMVGFESDGLTQTPGSTTNYYNIAQCKELAASQNFPSSKVTVMWTKAPHDVQWVHKGERIGDVFNRDTDAEFLTRVDCNDGTSRYSISAPFQQKALGEIVEPGAVQLEGCRPVKVSVGVQRRGSGLTTGTDPAPWNPTPKPGDPPNPGTTTVAPPVEVPDEVKDWMEQTPQCWDGSCRLTLKKSTTGTGTDEIDCFVAPAECVNWHEESVNHPNRYRCYYAGKVRPLSDCLVYRPVFDKDKVQTGTGYGDPKTGETTGTGVTTNPGAATSAMRDPVSNPQGERQCWPKGWSAFNPFEWVFQPVRCALEWAFVPRTQKITQLQSSVRLAAYNSKPGQVAMAIESWSTFVPAASGCMGPEFRINMLGINYSGYPMQACSGGLATAASMTRIALGIVIVILGIGAISRYIGRVFGFTGLGTGSSES